MVLAGTIEGTVFGFALEPRAKASALNNSHGGGDAPLDGKVELGRLLLKFEHTSLCIKSVTCSRDQVRVHHLHGGRGTLPVTQCYALSTESVGRAFATSFVSGVIACVHLAR